MRQGLAQPAPRVLPASLGRQVRPALAARALLEQPGSAPLGLLVSALKARGVRFEICEITLKNRNLNKAQFSMDAEFTPSGVVRVGRLQAREGYAYIKP